MKPIYSTLVLVTFLAVNAHAQTIERVKMTDSELSCQQMYLETVDMDSIIAKNKVSPAVAPVASGISAGQVANVATQTEGAANIAQSAATLSAYSGGLGGLGGFGAIAGLSSLGSMFGGVAKMAQGSAAQQAASDAVAQQKAAAEQQAMAQITGQAQARKEHVTSLFLSKGCKLGDIQK